MMTFNSSSTVAGNPFLNSLSSSSLNPKCVPDLAPPILQGDVICKSVGLSVEALSRAATWFRGGSSDISDDVTLQPPHIPNVQADDDIISGHRYRNSFKRCVVTNREP